MTKKKAKSKAARKPARKKAITRTRKELNPAEVRKDVAHMVKASAKTMAQAVIDEGGKGQLATVRYLFEMAEIYPPSTDGSHATEDEDCLAQTLLRRLDLPDEPIKRDEEGNPVIPRKETESKEEAGEKKADEKGPGEPQGEAEGSNPETAGRESTVVSALV